MDIEQLKEQLLSDPEVRRMVGQRAHEIYLERRGLRAAHPAEDWLRAESEILPRLIEHMIERNRQAMAAEGEPDPVATRAAAHFEQELHLAETALLRPITPEALAGQDELHEQNAERLAEDAAEPETIPNATGVLEKKPVKKAAAKKAAAKKAPAKKAAAKKAPAKKAAAKKAPVKKAAPAKPKEKDE